MVQIDIKFDDHALADAFKRKASQMNSEFNKLTVDLVDIAKRWVQSEAPRKTGKLKASVQGKSWGSRGLIWLSKAIAPHWIYVIDGTKPHIIRAKYKKALKTPYGAFKSVKHPGTKSNPFIDRANDKMQGDINRRTNIFEKWLTEV
jgi:hypothetical protein